MNNSQINKARHAPNCLVSLKTWAAENPDKHCDCELRAIRNQVEILRETLRIARMAIEQHLSLESRATANGPTIGEIIERSMK